MSRGSMDVGTSGVSALQNLHALTGAAPASTTLGPHAVALGQPQQGPAHSSGFGDSVKAFLSSIGDKFASLRSGIAALPGKIETRMEEWATSRAQAKVAAWEGSNVDISKNNQTNPCSNSKGTETIQSLRTADKELGKAGMHQMSERMIDAFKGLATYRAAHLAQGKAAPTWQDCAREGLKEELMKSSSLKEAAKTIDSFTQHFGIYEKAGSHPELAELGRIIAGLRTEVTDLATIDASTRQAFTAELPGELGKPDNFFRSNTDASIGTATMLRNGNAKQADRLREAFHDMASAGANREALATIGDIKPGIKPNAEQMRAINHLTADFLDRSFGLSKDGGATFVDRFDATARSFLKDTADEIAQAPNTSADLRNECIRKWYSNGVALRDLGPVLMEEASKSGQTALANLVATNVLRLVGNVGPNDKMGGPETQQAYADFAAQKAPQVQHMLELLGMPLAS